MQQLGGGGKEFSTDLHGDDAAGTPGSVPRSVPPVYCIAATLNVVAVLGTSHAALCATFSRVSQITDNGLRQ